MYMNNIYRNVVRHRGKSLVAVFSTTLIILLLHIYLGNIMSNQIQLESLPEAIPVEAYISNLNGSQKVNIEIEDKIIQGLKASENVKNLTLTVRLKAGIGEFPLEKWKEHLKLNLLAVNDIRAVSGINDIKWYKGEDSSVLNSNKNICIVSRQLMTSEGWKLGDEIILCQYYYIHEDHDEISMDFLKTSSYKIVGSIERTVVEGENSDILLPFDTVMDCFQKEKIEMYAESAMFTVADPLKLNDFKKEMKSLGLLNVEPLAEFSYKGCALNVNDSAFINAASRLQKIIHTGIIFIPLSLLLLLGASYILTFLLLQSRNYEIGLMRDIGLARRKCFLIFGLEQLVLTGMGIVFGSVLSIIILDVKSQNLLIVGMIELFFSTIGISIALWKLLREDMRRHLSKV